MKSKISPKIMGVYMCSLFKNASASKGTKYHFERQAAFFCRTILLYQVASATASRLLPIATFSIKKVAALLFLVYC